MKLRKKRNITKIENEESSKQNNTNNTNTNNTNTNNTNTNNTNKHLHNNHNNHNNPYDNDNNYNEQYYISDNLNNLHNNQDDKGKLNEKISASDQRTINKQNKREALWDTVSWQAKDIVIKCILEQMPELKIPSHQIMQYLRLLHCSNQSHLKALDKIKNNITLGTKDILPVNTDININPVYYPDFDNQETNQLSVNQMLTKKQMRFLDNIRNNMEEKEAFLEAGFSEAKLQLLNVITTTNESRIKHPTNRPFLKTWMEYWKIKKEKRDASGITEDFILSSFKKQIEFNPKSLVDENNNFKNLHDLGDDTAKMISEIKLSEKKVYYHKTKQTTTTTKTISIKLGSKDTARKELAKLQQGIFNHIDSKTVNINHKHSGGVLHGNVDVNKLTQSQLDKILMIDNSKNNLIELNNNDIEIVD